MKTVSTYQGVTFVRSHDSVDSAWDYARRYAGITESTVYIFAPNNKLVCEVNPE